jgi:hypothetical protein
MGRINAALPATGETSSPSQINLTTETSKNSPEFFILSDLYSKAMVIFLA